MKAFYRRGRFYLFAGMVSSLVLMSHALAYADDDDAMRHVFAPQGSVAPTPAPPRQPGPLQPASCPPQWEQLAPPIATGPGQGSIRAVTYYNKETIVAGDFAAAPGQPPLNRIARRNHQGAWLPLGQGLCGVVNALAIYQGELYVGGAFLDQDPGQCVLPDPDPFRWSGSGMRSLLKKWNSTDGWSDVAQTPFGKSQVKALIVHNESLYLGGLFSEIEWPDDQISSGYGMARWDGTTGSNDGCAESPTAAFALVDEDGPGPQSPFLYSGGDSVVYRFDGSNWSELYESVISGGWYDSRPDIRALAGFDDGSGTGAQTVYIGGLFYHTFGGGNGDLSFNVLKWNQNTSSWSPVGGGLWFAETPQDQTCDPGSEYCGAVHAMSVFRSNAFPSAQELFVAGDFNRARQTPTDFLGGATVPNLVKWNGTQWSTVVPAQSCNSAPVLCDEVLSLFPYRRDYLYIGSRRDSDAPGTAQNLARWGCPMPLQKGGSPGNFQKEMY